MLLLADRNFYGYELWNAAAATGADLLWRVKASLHLPVVRPVCRTGPGCRSSPTPPRCAAAPSATASAAAAAASWADAGPLPGITVRVIEFWLTVAADDGAVRTERYRLITTLLDHSPLPRGRAGRRVCPPLGDRDRVPRMQDLPARPRPDPARPAPPPWPARNCGPTWPSTRPSAPSSSAPPPAPGWTPTGSPSPPRCTPPSRTMTAGPRQPRAPPWPQTETEILSCLGPPARGPRLPPGGEQAILARTGPGATHDGPISQHADYTATITTPARPARQTTTDQAKQPHRATTTAALSSWHWVITGRCYIVAVQ